MSNFSTTYKTDMLFTVLEDPLVEIINFDLSYFQYPIIDPIDLKFRINTNIDEDLIKNIKTEIVILSTDFNSVVNFKKSFYDQTIYGINNLAIGKYSIGLSIELETYDYGFYESYKQYDDKITVKPPILSGIIENRQYEYELILCLPNKQELMFLQYDDMTYNPLFLEYNKLDIIIPRIIETVESNNIVNPCWDKILSEYLIKLTIKDNKFTINEEYFVIQNPAFSSDDLDRIQIVAYSYESTFLNDKNLEGFRDNVKKLYDPTNSIDPDDNLPQGILNYILDKKFYNCWTVGYIDPSLLKLERIVSFSGNNLKSVFDSLSESFICAFVFDSVNMQINIYERRIGMLGINRGLIVSGDNYAMNFKYETNNDGIKTRVTILGKNNSVITSYNPTGQMYVDDFSYFKNLLYMSQDLIDAIDRYELLLKSKEGLFLSYVNALNVEDNSVLPLIENLKNDLDWKNNFTQEQIKELTPFIKEEVKTISTISDPEELYNFALRHLKTVAYVPVQITIDCVDLFQIQEYQFDWQKLNIGDFANIYRTEFNLEYREMRLVSYTHNPKDNKLTLEFSNRDELITKQWLDNQFFKKINDTQQEYVYDKGYYDFELAFPDFEFPELPELVGDIVDKEIDDKVINPNTAKALSLWPRCLAVEWLETNFEAIDARLPAPSTLDRYFIRIYEQNIEFLYSTISPSVIVDYTTPCGRPIYWNEIVGNDRYEYFTLTDPVELNSALKKATVAEKNAYRQKYIVKARQTLTTIPRLAMKYDAEHPNTIPKMIWGIGEDEVGDGRAFTYKDLDAFYIVYSIPEERGILSKGEEVGIRITRLGAFEYRDIEDGEWKDIKLSGGHIITGQEKQQPNLQFVGEGMRFEISNNDGSKTTVVKGIVESVSLPDPGGTYPPPSMLPSHIIIDHKPTQAEIDSWNVGTLVLVYNPNNPYIP